MTSSQADPHRRTAVRLQEKLRSRLAGHGEQSDRIQLADRTAPLPLSFAQQRLWFLEQFEPGAVRLQQRARAAPAGALDGAPLRSALQRLAARHESLRTTLPATSTAKACRSSIRPPTSCMPVADLADGGDSAPGAALNQLMTSEYSRPFDLRPWPAAPGAAGAACAARARAAAHRAPHHHRWLVDGNPGLRNWRPLHGRDGRRAS